ncbi:MAG TPA: hypothetical protein VME70_03050 [Mycobacteriales bacterium]|nr:hypothetical protein [Mycobacteriales bacterium]
MRVVRTRTAVLVLALALGTAPLLPAGTAVATTPNAQPYPMTSPITGLSSAAQMVQAHGRLFVSSGPNGSRIEVLSAAGTRIGELVGEAGADGMVASADGSTLYVALNGASAIAVIDTATMKETARYSVDACPASLALAGGRLFYSYGCDSSGGVSSVDPATGGTPFPALTGNYGGLLVRGSGSTLAVVDAVNAVTTYTAAADGSVSELASASIETAPRDLAFTADGDDVLVTSAAPYQITAYDATTMNQTATYTGVAYPEAVATDPNGNYVAGGFDSGAAAAILYGATSKSVLWERYTTSPFPETWTPNASDDHVIPQTLTFSSDGSHVYGLVVRQGLPGIYFFSSTIAPKKTAVSIEIPAVHSYRKDRTVVALVPGSNGVPVNFTMTEAGQLVSAGVVDTRSGVARLTFQPFYSGSVTAIVPGTASTYPSSVSAKYVVYSKTVVRFTGKHTMHHGIAVYRKFRQIGVEFTTLPLLGGRPASYKVQAWHKGRWYTVAVGTASEPLGGLNIYPSARPPKHLLLRIHLVAKSTSYSRGSSATSKRFELV